MLKFLAFTRTLRDIVLSYVRSLRVECGLLLHDALFPVLQFIYSDLVRTGFRDHLIGVSFGVSEELSSFSTHLMHYLGMSYIKIYFYITFFNYTI